MVFLNNLFLGEKDGWFTLRGWEGLFHVDLETGICECEETVIKENSRKNIDILFNYKNFIFLLPTGENNIIEIYDIQKKQYQCYIRLDPREKYYFDNAVISNDNIFLINNWSTNPAIFVLDINKLYIKNKIVMNREILWKYDTPGRLFSKDIVVKDNIMYLASSSEHYIISIDLIEYTIKYIYLPCNLKGFVAMCSNGKDYWLTDEDALVIKWSLEGIEREFDLKDIIDLDMDLTEEEIKYRNASHGYRGSYMYFNSSIYKNGSIFWIPGRSGKLIKLDIFSGQFSTIYERPELQGYTSWILSPVTENNGIFLFSVREQKLIKIDDDIEIIDFKIVLKNNTIIRDGNLMYEENYFMSTLVDFIKNNYIDRNFLTHKKDAIGKDIWISLNE